MDELVQAMMKNMSLEGMSNLLIKKNPENALKVADEIIKKYL